MPKAIAQAIHTWYTERWNNHYADLNEPGWGVSEDITALVLAIAPNVDVTAVKAALAAIDPRMGD